MIPNRPAHPPATLSLVALTVSIPAFYLILTGSTAQWRAAGSLMYGLVALLMVMDLRNRRGAMSLGDRWRASWLDTLIFWGAIASAWPSGTSWSLLEWLLRLGYCTAVFIRLSMLTAVRLAKANLLQLLAIAAMLLAIAGAGFVWLEPRVQTYADGLWLAFITGATVGYGDIVPSTPASRIFAVFIVLLGYAIFSVVTASIAALFVGEDEKRLERDLHADIRALRGEIHVLRGELHRALTHGRVHDGTPQDQAPESSPAAGTPPRD